MHKYVVVDAFGGEPLRGNPVAVFFDADDIPAERMQRIAREMNLSETTFVLAPERDGDARIRIFTPVNELPFAGHPMLGTAIALGAGTDRDKLLLETRMGTIPFELDRKDGEVVAARMQQPIPTWEPFARADELLAALGVRESTLPVEIYRNGPRHVFVGLDSIDALSRLHPDHRALAAFPDMATNCFAGAGSQWRSRMFSPAYGVVEDAATGSAAGPLALHLSRHGRIPYGQPVDILQGVEIGRPSLMLARAEGSGDRFTSVEVGGAGALFARGTALV
ncbi:PhzF family phenazine biosynthesis isomerase [Streptomyces niger]|uniref:PhzF family phenazine biosynthesis isomerase n=1 Tax=Streptomyces niger TaxID=66373 RepID=UPI00069B2914|nr:PhzF family phenazine biosynthesis isomerase [Streptomyces niger]